jgi:hypothetical protein
MYIYHKNEIICRDSKNFGRKSKSYDATMKRTVKEYHLLMRYISRNTKIRTWNYRAKVY